MDCFQKKIIIITSVTEHNSVLRPINYLRAKGAEVSYINVFENGVLNLEEAFQN